MFKAVTFYTDQLKSLQGFYMNILELEIIEIADQSFTMKVGTTEVTFKASEEPAFYHFAINVPGNQFSLLKAWLRGRHPLNREGGRDEVYFSSFDADSIYFTDAANNIVELIGRRKRDLFGNLSPAVFLNLSEVGLVTPHIVEVGEQLQDYGIPLWGSTAVQEDGLNFLGRDESFFVLVPPERKWYFSDQPAKTYPLKVTLHNDLQISLDTNGKVNIEKLTEDEAARENE